MGSRHIIGIGLLLLWGRAASAESFATEGKTSQGRLRYVMVGASMVDNQGLDNGVNCLKESATTEVRSADLTPRSRLVSATLYVSGSLFGDDGDYASPPTEIYTTTGLDAQNAADIPALEAAAIAAADYDVDFMPPGATSPITVSAPAGTAMVSVFPGGNPVGNVAFFVTPIDVTNVIANQGGGILAGTYTVAGLRADICRGLEVTCVDPPNPPTCGTNPGSAVHFNAAASFALLIIVEDPELPLHAVSVFDGNLSLAGTSITVNLNLTNSISTPAVGSLTIYGLEGDLLIPDNILNRGPCHAEEYIEVDGDADPTVNGVCLVDDDNPLGNLFNSTINVSPAVAQPSCRAGLQPFQCCLGDGLCGVTGVDIDRFDISSALVPGANRVRVTVGSGNDRVGLAAVVIGVDVFEPVLRRDSQIRVFEEIGPDLTRVENGSLRLGSNVVYSVAVSNTGNVAARGVMVRMSAPPNTASFALSVKPTGATAVVDPAGGDFGTGVATVSGFEVPAGEIAEVRVEALVTCGAGRRQIDAKAAISSDEISEFEVKAPSVEAGGPGVGACDGLDPDGPFKIVPEPKDLRGGAATCASTTRGGWALLVGFLLFFRASPRRRRGLARGLWALGLLAAVGAMSCGKRHETPGEPPPSPPKEITDLTGLPGDSCGTELMVWVARQDGSRFCIDRFEASYGDGALGDAMQGADDTDNSLNDSTSAAASVNLGVKPANGVSWYQARALCENAGKRLCSRADWERACRGPQALIYPYGDSINDQACNGFFNYPPDKPAVTGSLNTCASTCGAYDMSGNLEEWVFDAVPRVPGTAPLVDRLLRGGSFKSNSNALACIGDEFHAPPGSSDVDRGFRCCSDGPI